MQISRQNITVELPTGWEGSIYVATTAAAPSQHGAYAMAGQPTAQGQPILHAANFALPAARGDFGSGAVDRMAGDDVFLALIEFHPDAASTALFVGRSRPTELQPADYRPEQLQRTIPGQAGLQRFFTENGRAFCLYVVLGAHSRRAALAPPVSGLVRGLAIGRRP